TGPPRDVSKATRAGDQFGHVDPLGGLSARIAALARAVNDAGGFVTRSPRSAPPGPDRNARERTSAWRGRPSPRRDGSRRAAERGATSVRADEALANRHRIAANPRGSSSTARGVCDMTRRVHSRWALISALAVVAPACGDDGSGGSG